MAWCYGAIVCKLENSVRSLGWKVNLSASLAQDSVECEIKNVTASYQSLDR